MLCILGVHNALGAQTEQKENHKENYKIAQFISVKLSLITLKLLPLSNKVY